MHINLHKCHLERTIKKDSYGRRERPTLTLLVKFFRKVGAQYSKPACLYDQMYERGWGERSM